MAALCVVAGLDPPEVAALSNLAGGQVCEKAGAETGHLELPALDLCLSR